MLLRTELRVPQSSFPFIICRISVFSHSITLKMSFKCLDYTSLISKSELSRAISQIKESPKKSVTWFISYWHHFYSLKSLRHCINFLSSLLQYLCQCLEYTKVPELVYHSFRRKKTYFNRLNVFYFFRVSGCKTSGLLFSKSYTVT